MTQDQLSSALSLRVGFSTISVPNPLALRHDDRRDSQATPEEQANIDYFHHQRDAGLLAMNVVKDLHLASNAESAELGQCRFVVRRLSLDKMY